MPVSLSIFFGLFAVLMIADLVLILRRGYSATVSANLLKFSKAYPIIPLLLGVCAGHTLWPNESACDALIDRAAQERVIHFATEPGVSMWTMFGDEGVVLDGYTVKLDIWTPENGRWTTCEASGDKGSGKRYRIALVPNGEVKP